MKPYILDLRKEGCPMALLRAKRESLHVGNREWFIQIDDMSSMKDIMRYFDKQGVLFQVKNMQQYYVLTVNKRECT